MSTGNTGTVSTHFNFTLPGYDDDTDIDDLNTNFNIIDTSLYDAVQDIATNASDISALQDSVSPTFGNVDWYSSNVTGDAGRNFYCVIGGICIAWLEFTPKVISNQTGICKDLPRPHASAGTNTFVFGGNKQQCVITDSGNDGRLVWWFPTDTTTKNRTELLLVYPVRT